MEPKKPQVYPHLKEIISNLTASTLKRMDSCLSGLYSSYQRTGSLPVEESNEADCAGFDTEKNNVRNCGVVLAEQLHSMVTAVFNRSKEAKTVNRATVLASSMRLQTGRVQSNSFNQLDETKICLARSVALASRNRPLML